MSPHMFTGTENRKCVPSGRKDGQRCLAAPFSFVTAAALPPSSETCQIGPPFGEKRIPLSLLQVPPPKSPPESARTVTGPPFTPTFFNFFPEPNPMKRLSGDQNGP